MGLKLGKVTGLKGVAQPTEDVHAQPEVVEVANHPVTETAMVKRMHRMPTRVRPYKQSRRIRPFRVSFAGGALVSPGDCAGLSAKDESPGFFGQELLKVFGDGMRCNSVDKRMAVSAGFGCWIKDHIHQELEPKSVGYFVGDS